MTGEGQFNVAPTFDIRGHDDCKSREGIVQRRSSPIATIIIMLSIYSTVMSGLWFAVSIAQPRYGSAISSRGRLSPESASILTTFLAKTIEMSFIAVFVAFTGQALSRRAISRGSLGVTISEITMRNWLTQPGTMLTHSEVLRYAGATTLGCFVLMATLVTTFYITASDALVKPNLLYGPWEQKTLNAFARTDYANAAFIKADCPTVHDGIDAKESGTSCINLHYSGDSWHNLISYMERWKSFVDDKPDGSLDYKERPTGSTLIYNNVTLRGTWIETENSDMAKNMEKYKRIVNNVTMAMPHPGVHTAATHENNGILQPNDLNGVGEYIVQASVVSPAVNVLCVNMNEEEVKPLVYALWPNASVVNASAEIKEPKFGWDKNLTVKYPDFGNRTVVDDIFQWGPKYGRRPPIFSQTPKALNTVTYVLPFWDWQSPGLLDEDAVYVMATMTTSPREYAVCQLRSWVTPKCSTNFFMSGTSGGEMTANCDAENPDRYSAKFPDAYAAPNKGWNGVAERWLSGLGLQSANADSSGARTVALAALTEAALNPKLPSMAETLAVLSGVAMMKGSLGSTYHIKFDKTTEDMNGTSFASKPGFPETFDSSIRQQQYTSSFNDKWKGIFYIILAFVFFLNVFCLQYFLRNAGFLTDFTEPANIFTLAINSPSSHQLSGACGGGPRERDLVVPFRVSHDERTGHFYFQEANEKPWRGKYRNTFASGLDPLIDESGKIKSSYRRLSSRKNWL